MTGIETLLAYGLMAAVSAGVAYVIYRLYKKVRRILHPPPPPPIPFPRPSSQSQQGKGRDAKSGASEQEEGRQDQEHAARESQSSRERQKQSLVKQIANSNPDLGKKAAQCAGVRVGEYVDMNDARLVAEIARRIEDQELLILHTASTTLLDIDVQKRSERRIANYPTDSIEPEVMTEIGQFADMLPEQLMADDDEFFMRLALGEGIIMQPFEQIDVEKILYTLLDVSKSMEYLLESGLPRHILARGIMIRLLYRAIIGGSKYYHRDFDGAPHQLRLALTPHEAEVLCDVILHGGLTNGGTNIPGALICAINDIRQKQSGIQEAEILLVSDGEDEKIGDPEEIRKLLGDDIRLHVALIGKGSAILQAVAHTYIHFK